MTGGTPLSAMGASVDILITTDEDRAAGCMLVNPWETQARDPKRATVRETFIVLVVVVV